MIYCVSDWIVKVCMIPFVFITGGIHAVEAFLSKKKRREIVKQDDNMGW